MANITNVIVSPVQGKTGTLIRSSGYEYRDFYYTNSNGNRIHVVGWHKALDITTLGTIVAFEKGKVISVIKNVTGQTTSPAAGNQIMLEHANGSRTFYGHMDPNSIPSNIYIGNIIDAGTPLGTDIKKTTGNSTGLHLHFAIFVGGEAVNPIDFMQGIKKLKPYGYIEPIPASNDIVYVVKKGDTLSKIAAMYNTTWQELAKINGIINANVISVGQNIKIRSKQPTETIYTIKSGDNLSKIATKFGTTWQKIYANNKNVIGSNPNVLKIGTKVVIK